MSATAVAGLAVGQGGTARFASDAVPPMAATVIEISGRADPRTGTFKVDFSLPARPELRSGLIGTVTLATPRPPSTLHIPVSALFSARADEGFVWLHDPGAGKVKARLVSLGAISDAGAEVRAGLVPGDRIVATGVDRLSEGQAVRAAG
jgi:multidrug efflux pump subunit AcrA (membrane-fusion protein)